MKLFNLDGLKSFLRWEEKKIKQPENPETIWYCIKNKDGFFTNTLSREERTTRNGQDADWWYRNPEAEVVKVCLCVVGAQDKEGK